MRGGSLWLSGLILLLFSFSALRFHSILALQKENHERLLKVEYALEGGGVPRVGVKTDAVGAETKTIESLSLKIETFIRELSSRQKGLDRKLSDLDDRINRERETILADLGTFLEDMRNERREFSGEISRLQSGMNADELPQLAEINKVLGTMEAAIKDFSTMVQEEATRRDEAYKRETGGLTVEGVTTGPGSDRRTRY